MTPADLAGFGRLLYGPRWQTELARACGVTPRTMRHWASGARPIPAGLGGLLFDLLSARCSAIARVMVERAEGA
jgi:DNA-binding transcriptional regulator YdaS (Cro superfamily)